MRWEWVCEWDGTFLDQTKNLEVCPAMSSIFRKFQSSSNNKTNSTETTDNKKGDGKQSSFDEFIQQLQDSNDQGGSSLFDTLRVIIFDFDQTIVGGMHTHGRADKSTINAAIKKVTLPFLRLVFEVLLPQKVNIGIATFSDQLMAEGNEVGGVEMVRIILQGAFYRYLSEHESVSELQQTARNMGLSDMEKELAKYREEAESNVEIVQDSEEQEFKIQTMQLAMWTTDAFYVAAAYPPMHTEMTEEDASDRKGGCGCGGLKTYVRNTIVREREHETCGRVINSQFSISVKEKNREIS
eukprot:TRINITY_DN3424_c0_g1_i10.p1 TRINITY_DN3424_c0_g1~~TRINITY_DN3424_c0_g1_i10.p1  ORF type:complete len:297 (-),score=47.36 TRINITY_DN3424_c0_g1_i10:731-1621(-)